MQLYQLKLSMIMDHEPDADLTDLLIKVLNADGYGVHTDQENREESSLEIIEYHHADDNAGPCRLLSKLTSARELPEL